MAKKAVNLLLNRMNALVGQSAEGEKDQHLLERFITRHDESAFAVLLERHGSMVLGVCRRALPDEHLAQDVFQATFLVLIRNARSIRKGSSLASWLHGVALRLARKAKADRERNSKSDQRPGPESPRDPCVEANWREVRQIIDEELQRLPESYRLPLVLCYLEGRTRDEAAMELGWTLNRLKGLLERGRQRLRQRLIARGLAPSTVGVVLLAETTLAAPVPPLLSIATLQAAHCLALGKGLHASGVSASVIKLSQGGVSIMRTNKVLMNLLIAVSLGIIGTGTALWAQQPGPVPQVDTLKRMLPAEEPASKEIKQQKVIEAKPKPVNSDYKYEFAIEATQPAGSPLLLKLIWTNTSKEPIGFWCGLGETCPPLFGDAKVTDAEGKTRELQMSNGQAQLGSGINKTLEAGDSVVIPAVIAPLPKGSYVIEFRGATARIKVDDNAELLEKHNQDLLTRIEKREIFARHVFDTHPTQSLLDICLKKLSSDDVDTAVQYAWLLERHKKLPASAVTVVARAMDKQLSQTLTRVERCSALTSLADLARRIGSDEALDLVLKVCHNELSEGSCICALGFFKQERATKELHGFLKSEVEIQRYYAAMTLAERKDEAAIDVLAAIAGDRKSSSTLRTYACRTLVKFPNDPRVEPAIRICLDDIHCRDEARDALKCIEELRKK